MVKDVRLTRLFIVIAVIAVAFTTVIIAYDMMLAGEEQFFLPMKDSLVAFISSNHPDAAEFLVDLNLIYLGNGVFSGDGWYIEIEGVSPNWTAYADFSSTLVQNASGIPHRIQWHGVISNGTITETNYTHAV